MIGTFLSRGKARGIHFAGLVSVGNEVDLSIGEICAATLDDPGIDGYVLFLETMRKAHALRAFALEAAKRGKPVLAYKLGRSAAARELAVSHTGALAGSGPRFPTQAQRGAVHRRARGGFCELARSEARARG